MYKKLIVFFVVAIFLFGFRLAFASLVINEVMYDLSGSDSTSGKSREWIEVYNPDTSDISVDASKWRVYDGAGNRTINGEVDFSLPAGSFVIWAGDKDTFLSDHPGFTGVVYDTGITSLNNTGATLKILDPDGNVVDSLTYALAQGGAGDGNSLQKISGSWVGAAPTPGTANQTSGVVAATPAGGPLVSSDSSNNNSSTQTTTETKNKTVEEQKIKTQITANNFVFAGSPATLQAKAIGYNKEQLHYGKYFWNFGDGDSKEINLSDSQKFAHVYSYPGDYVVTLEYYMNSYSDTADASDKVAIKVVEADIAISAVGDEKDFFVELSNNTSYDADVSGWTLGSVAKSFIFPKNTVISSRKKMTVSASLTNFSTEDKNTLKLMTPQGKTVFAYSPSVAPAPVAVENPKIVIAEVKSEKNPEKSEESQKSEEPKKPSNEMKETIPTPDPDPSSTPNLSATALSSGALESSSSSFDPTMIYLVSAALIVLSAGAAYFIRQRSNINKNGGDFNILDE